MNQRLARLLAVLVPGLVVAAAFGAASAETTIRYAHWGSNAWLEAAVKAFNESQDEVYVEFVPVSGYLDAMTVQLASGVAPEVFSTGSVPGYGWVEWVENASPPLVMDLTPLIERDAAEFNLADIPLPMQRISQFQGRWYGVPFTVWTGSAILYNIDLFEESGIAEPPADWTLDDFLGVARKLTRDTSGDGVTDLWGLQHNEYNFRLKQAYLFNEEGTEFRGRERDVLSALDFYNELYRQGLAPRPSEPGGAPDLQSCRVGMYRQRPFAVFFAGQAMENGCRVSAQLHPIDPETGSRGAQIIDDGNFFSINANIDPEKLEAAWSFVKFMVTEPGIRAAWESVGWLQSIPIFQDLMFKYYLNPSDPKYQHFNLSVFIENIRYATVRRDLPRTNVAEITSIISRGLAEIADGVISPRVFVEQVADQINAMIHEGM